MEKSSRGCEISFTRKIYLNSKFRKIFPSLLAFLVLAMLYIQVADASNSLITGERDADEFKGVNTIIFTQVTATKTLLNEGAFLNDVGKTQPLFQDTLDQMFSDVPAIKVLPAFGTLGAGEGMHRKASQEQIASPHTLTAVYYLSYREAKVGVFKTVTLASLSLELTRHLSPDRHNLSDHTTYAFIVPSDPDEQKSALAEGIRYVTRNLPAYICRGNGFTSCPAITDNPP